MRYLGFPVTFGYNEKTILSNGRHYVHRGIDLGSWVGNELKIAGKLVGITGDTGLVEGPHTHIQAGRDEWAQQTIDPAPYIGKPGKVVKVGWGNEWGNYIAIRSGDVNVFYCHLKEVRLKVGDVITNANTETKEKKKMVDMQQLEYIYRLLLGSEPTDHAIKNFLNKRTFSQVVKSVKGSAKFKEHIRDMAKSDRNSLVNSHLPAEMRK